MIAPMIHCAIYSPAAISRINMIRLSVAGRPVDNEACRSSYWQVVLVKGPIVLELHRTPLLNVVVRYGPICVEVPLTPLLIW
jgi:hypothetical protein